MEVIGFDKFVSAERFRDLGVEGVETSDELYERADFITIHLPKTPETINWIDATALTRMKDGVRIVNCARGELIDLEALQAALDSGKVAGEAVAPFVGLCRRLGTLAQGLSTGTVDRVQAEFRGRIAEHDTRVLGISVLAGVLRGHTEEQVNLVNASALGEERGIEL